MTWLSDDAVSRLREVSELPDLTGTRYELVRELGRGGMGIVYEVRDNELQRTVAMKVANEDWVREARIIASLEHPGIVPVHDAGVLADGRFFYTMKLVRGLRLDEWSKGEHGLTERLRLFARICEPVAFAHANEFVHRDLKPENVMVGELGSVLVMDWGVARKADEHDGMVAGTFGYMAPEQARGEAAGPRSDVHALGAVLKTLLDKPPRPFAAIIAKAMSAEPSSRYEDARALREDILRFLDGVPVSAYRESFFERAARWAKLNRVLLGLVAAYLLMRAIVFFSFRL
jgi:eukaryotic-like serine/threonine-protein kinase